MNIYRIYLATLTKISLILFQGKGYYNLFPFFYLCPLPYFHDHEALPLQNPHTNTEVKLEVMSSIIVANEKHHLKMYAFTLQN